MYRLQLTQRSVADCDNQAFSYKNYSWISILVNVPATLFATGYYELLMRDSLQKIAKGGAIHEGGEEGLSLHLTKTRQDIERGATTAIEKIGTTNQEYGV